MLPSFDSETIPSSETISSSEAISALQALISKLEAEIYSGKHSYDVANTFMQQLIELESQVRKIKTDSKPEPLKVIADTRSLAETLLASAQVEMKKYQDETRVFYEDIGPYLGKILPSFKLGETPGYAVEPEKNTTGIWRWKQVLERESESYHRDAISSINQMSFHEEVLEIMKESVGERTYTTWSDIALSNIALALKIMNGEENKYFGKNLQVDRLVDALIARTHPLTRNISYFNNHDRLIGFLAIYLLVDAHQFIVKEHPKSYYSDQVYGGAYIDCLTQLDELINEFKGYFFHLPSAYEDEDGNTVQSTSMILNEELFVARKAIVDAVHRQNSINYMHLVMINREKEFIQDAYLLLIEKIANITLALIKKEGSLTDLMVAYFSAGYINIHGEELNKLLTEIVKVIPGFEAIVMKQLSEGIEEIRRVLNEKRDLFGEMYELISRIEKIWLQGRMESTETPIHKEALENLKIAENKQLRVEVVKLEEKMAYSLEDFAEAIEHRSEGISLINRQQIAVVLFSHFLPTVEIKKETETNAKKKDSEQKSKSKPEGTCAIQ